MNTVISITLGCLLAALFFGDTVDSKQHTARIYHGRPVDITAYPYQLSLQITYNNGTDQGWKRGNAGVIGDYWAVTVGHLFDFCREKGARCIILMRGGSNYYYRGGTTYECAELVIHPLYSDFDYDLALLRTKKSFLKESFIRPLALPNSPASAGTVATACGWANTTLDPNGHTDHLKAVDMKVIKLRTCELFYGQSISADFICAGMPPLNSSVTMGDSGTPLAVNGTIIGLDSCSNNEDESPFPYPVIFTNIYYFRDWIKNRTGI